MADEFFNTPDELKQAFCLHDAPQYERFTPLGDRKVGFSVQRAYPKDIRYIPPKRKDGSDDTVALIHVVYTHPSETSESIQPSKVPLILTITPFSRYLAEHFDYDFSNEQCPTEESVRLSKTTPRPIELESIGGYFYNHLEKSFFDNSDNRLSGIAILDKFFELHCNTIHTIKGLRLRWKLSAKSLSLGLCTATNHVLKSMLRFAFGRTLESKDFAAGFLREYKKDDMKLLKTESISVFGYKASQNVIITFAIFVVVVYTITYLLKYKSGYISVIVSNGLLVVCASLIVLWFLDHAVPNFLLKIINLLTRLRFKLLTMKFKF